LNTRVVSFCTFLVRLNYLKKKEKKKKKVYLSQNIIKLNEVNDLIMK
jgi:hypothetical protein